MKTTILFPSDYFNIKKIDEQFETEYEIVCSIPNFQIAFYNHDQYVQDGQLKIYPAIENMERGLCICRTWMMTCKEYQNLLLAFDSKKLNFINNLNEYERLHLFPNIFPTISEYTPKILSYKDIDEIDANEVNKTFERFMVKDFVKSVKGYDFPQHFNTPIMQDELMKNVARFVDLRDSLFTEGIVFKEYVDLKKYGDVTNEYRAFYLFGDILSISKNSNQPDSCPFVPIEHVEKFDMLESHYYTVDFAELSNGEFIVIEVGDGQVSGLSPNQDIFKYYDDMHEILTNHYARK